MNTLEANWKIIDELYSDQVRGPAILFHVLVFTLGYVKFLLEVKGQGYQNIITVDIFYTISLTIDLGI